MKEIDFYHLILAILFFVGGFILSAEAHHFISWLNALAVVAFIMFYHELGRALPKR